MSAPASIGHLGQAAERPPRRLLHNPSLHALLRLLGYVRPHRTYAVWTTLFGVLGFLLSFAYPWIIGSVVDLISQPRGTGAEHAERLRELTQMSVGAAVLHALVVYGRGHFNVHLGNGIARDLRRDLFEHLQRLGSAFYTRQRSGSIIARVIQDVHESMAVIYGGILVAAMDAVQLGIATILLINISLKLALACLLVLPLYGLVFAAFNARVRRASDRVAEQFSQLSANLNERVAGQALIKTYTAERRELARFGEDIEHHHRLVVDQSHHGHLVVSYGEVLVHIGTTVVIGLGGWLGLKGELTPGMLTRFLGYAVILYGPVRRLAELNITYQSSMAAMRRVFRLLEVEPAIAEPRAPHTAPVTRGAVRFDNVWFRFTGSEAEARLEDSQAEPRSERAPPSSTRADWVLRGLSFEATPGERVAIVGVSGAGKTSLVSLIPRLYDVQRGQLLIDGVDVRDYALRSLRAGIAVVQQESFLFSGSIRENISYGRPGATELEMLEASRAANMDAFVESLPRKYDTELGERGINLSGGQRQRLSIARALLKQPRILILDEATSSLDAESESNVQEALERLMRGRTCFIVAHRLSTIRNADRIIVLEGGSIVESGSHQELLQQRGVYYRLVQKQSGV
jgi:ABC-type multidrug transport system fused ATPase/permease subunit